MLIISYQHHDSSTCTIIPNYINSDNDDSDRMPNLWNYNVDQYAIIASSSILLMDLLCFTVYEFNALLFILHT